MLATGAAMILAQFDFPYTGPWGREMASAMADLAADIAAEPGLRWKLWTEAPESGRAGGIYMFDSREVAEQYRTKHAARLEAIGITDLRCILFGINEGLSAITRGPVHAIDPQAREHD